MRSFRAAHAWLRGYSDALAGTYNENVWHYHSQDYLLGHTAGLRRSA